MHAQGEHVAQSYSTHRKQFVAMLNHGDVRIHKQHSAECISQWVGAAAVPVKTREIPEKRVHGDVDAAVPWTGLR